MQVVGLWPGNWRQSASFLKRADFLADDFDSGSNILEAVPGKTQAHVVNPAALKIKGSSGHEKHSPGFGSGQELGGIHPGRKLYPEVQAAIGYAPAEAAAGGTAQSACHGVSLFPVQPPDALQVWIEVLGAQQPLHNQLTEAGRMQIGNLFDQQTGVD